MSLIKNARNSPLSLDNNNNNQESQQSISSSSGSSLPLTSSSNERRSSNITSILEINHLESFGEYDDSGKVRILRKSASTYSFKKVPADLRRHSVGAVKFELCCDPK